jgi:hypothetical protein
MEAFADLECAEPLNRALDFLQECCSAEDSAMARRNADAQPEKWSGSGMCTFWPPFRCPAWAPYNPEDCDSTAVIAAELFHFGRITTERARSIALDSMPAFQKETGEFLAWRTQGVVPNPVDLALNINVVAFLAQTGSCGATVYRNACRAICEAAASCKDSPHLLDQLVPYYPDSAEVLLALHNALYRGARELLPAAAALHSTSFSAATFGGSAEPLFANEGRRTRWFSEAVSLARRIRRCTESRR